jgi:translation initiation factor IF-2
MGQITIEIPQSVNRNYRLVSEYSAKEVLSKVENLVSNENKTNDDEILGLWADRKDSVEEIARDLRKKSNNRSLKND